MPSLDIAQERLHNQHLAGPPLATPQEVVRWLGAVQAQDYLAAGWALGLRLGYSRDSAIEEAFSTGAILRTHVMRPTWHFVTPADIRWLLALTAPRVHALNAYYYRKSELDAATLARTDALLVAALQGGQHLTRPELAARLEQAGIAPGDGMRLSYIMMHAELNGLICSGPRRGKQFTYALLEERVPAAPPLTHEEALAALAGRYFTSHGPATLKDYCWWSGLSAAEANAGLELVKARLVADAVAGQTYWRTAAPPVTPEPAPTAYLLPNYDEYGVGYTNHDAVFDAARAKALDPRGAVVLGHVLVIDGQVAGAWKRTLGKAAVSVTVQTFAPLSAAEQAAVARAAARYGAFLGLPVVLA
jgi:hypothetical protein